MKTMTVKEISEVFGMDVSSVNKNVKELFPECVRKGVTTRLDESQVAQLSAKLKCSPQMTRPTANHNLGASAQVDISTIVTDQEKMAVIAQANIYIQELLQAAIERENKLRIELDQDRVVLNQASDH